MLCPVCVEERGAMQWSSMQWKAKTPHLRDPLGRQRNCCRKCSDCEGRYFSSHYAASHTELEQTTQQLDPPQTRPKHQLKWRCCLCDKKIRNWNNAVKCGGLRPAVGSPNVFVRCGLRRCSPPCYTDAMGTFEGQKCAGCSCVVGCC